MSENHQNPKALAAAQAQTDPGDGLTKAQATEAHQKPNPAAHKGGLDIFIEHDLRSQSQDFSLRVQLQTQAQRIALYGSSGAGKTLTLQAIAGLLRPQTGHIKVGEQLLFCAQRKINLAPQKRQLAYVLQDYGLFPHLTVAQNIAFGCRLGWRNPPRGWLPPQAKRWVKAFELQPVLAQYPHQISGGQKQRTALARALAVTPQLLLLDEPFAALDKRLREKLRLELQQVQRLLAVPTLLITHDPADVLALADEVFMIEQGRVVQHCMAHEFSAQ